jgi:hypothetical protein
MTKVKGFEKRSNSKVRGSRSWYQLNGLAIRNTHLKYESPRTYQSKVLTKVKVLLMDRQMARQTDVQTE